MPVIATRERAQERGLLFSKSVFADGQGRPLKAIRMGFASLNQEELPAAVALLKETIL